MFKKTTRHAGPHHPSQQNIGCEIRQDTKAWRIQVWTSFVAAALVVWGGFALAMGLTAWGLWRMEINPIYKAFLAVSWLFLISFVFTLAKRLRDARKAELAVARRQRHEDTVQ